MGRDQTRRDIAGFLAEVPVIDPHCHLDIVKPQAANLADLVLYHHVWIELVSAGMGQNEVTVPGLPHELEDPGIEPFERVRRALPYLIHTRNTTVGVLLRWLLRDLYGFDEELDVTNLDRCYRMVESAAARTDWSEQVFGEHCRIEQAITVEGRNNLATPRLQKASEALRAVNLMDGKLGPIATLAGMEAVFGREIRTATDFREYVVRALQSLDLKENRFLGAWVLPYMTDELADDRSVTGIIARARAGEALSHAELGSFTWYGLTTALHELRKSKLRMIQVIVGAEVLKPHRSVNHWSGRFTGAMGRLAGIFEDFRFNLSTASDLYTQDIAILAKHVPNISVAGYWWHTLYPYFIRKSIETRLDIVPGNKIVGFFSDAYHCEWCYPKLKLVRSILADVLTERVERGWYTLDTARQLVHQLLYGNPKALYEL
ncbi:hypothetical protein JW848_02565 [Candidatus Bipolaricaulota bacterium]|nr:hypothetical protein [Candidatus Bipolaricaulota bacterium]